MHLRSLLSIILLILCTSVWACTPNLDGTWHGTAELMERKTGEPVEPAPEVTLELTHEEPRVKGTVTFGKAKGPLESLEGKTVEISGMLDGHELRVFGSSDTIGMFDLESRMNSDSLEGRVTMELLTDGGHQTFVGHLAATAQ